MIASLKRGLYEVSIGLGKESYENGNDQLNDGDRYFGAICLALSPSLCYLIGKHNEDHNGTLEITSTTTIFIYSKFSSSTLSDEVVQDEEEAKSSTQSN